VTAQLFLSGDPAGVLRLQGALMLMAWQAAFVVPLRLQRMATDVVTAPVYATEAVRMVTEKLTAATLARLPPLPAGGDSMPIFRGRAPSCCC
jgi:hypothetical protein